MVIRISPSRRTITPGIPGRTIQDIGTASDIIKSVGQTASEIGENIARANNVAERTRAQNQFDSTLIDIQSRAEQDTDLSRERQISYDDEITKARSESARLISIPSEKSRFELESESKTEL